MTTPAPPTSLKRLRKEFNSWATEGPKYSKVLMYEDDIYHWIMTLQGPEQSPFANGQFIIDVQFPTQYPMKPPDVHFRTPVYHPNVSMKDGGAVCADVVARDWSPVLRSTTIAERLYEMLSRPHIDAPLDEEIAELYTMNQSKYLDTASQWTKKHANASANSSILEPLKLSASS
jgi:ubiquitin-conjugating enzyme E2 D/E